MNIKITKEDRKWSKAVRERDEYTCQADDCGIQNRYVHAHHIFPRARKHTRHEVENGITLCFWHHARGPDSAHREQKAFLKWIQKRMGKAKFMKLQDKSLNVIR